MAGWTLERLRLAGGRWEGRLSGPESAPPPPLVAIWAGAEVAEAQVTAAGPGQWTVTLVVPPAIMTDGTQALAIGPRGGAPLCLDLFAFGDALDGDLRAELEALRIEVGVLKRAIRRHLAGED